MCRVTVVGPTQRVDLALPGYIPFAELFPVVARFAGLDGAAAGDAAGGWVLQRLGHPPFPPDTTPVQAGLRDGELIYLSPRATPLPELAFDDMADVIAAGVGERPDRWTPADGRRVTFGAGAAALLAGVAVLAVAGPPQLLPALAAGAMTLVLLGGAAAASRAAGDAGAAALLGWAALPYALLAGLLGPARSTPLPQFGALELIAAFAAAFLAAIVAAVVTADGAAVFFGAAAAALLGAGGAALDYGFTAVHPAGAAAIVAALALALTPLIPAVAFRMAGLDLPPVPRDAAELRRDTLTVQGSQVLQRTAAADRVVSGAVSGIGLVAAVAAATLAFSPGLLPRVMCAVLGCALLLRSRVFRGRAQRLWLQVPGYGALLLLALAAALTAPQLKMLLLILPLLAGGAAILIGTGMWLPTHRASPFWGRAAEVLDMTLVISLIPLALGVTGVFGYIRGLSG
jgi:type VII secretion integral membrane protein EccD